VAPVFTQPWAGLSGQRRDQIVYYQYPADRARRTLRGIDEQIAKAEKAIVGKTAVKRNRSVRLAGGTRTVNRTLETKAPRPGRSEGLRHQPDHLPRRHSDDRRHDREGESEPQEDATAAATAPGHGDRPDLTLCDGRPKVRARSWPTSGCWSAHMGRLDLPGVR
jgi:hypothetical protein